LSGRIIEGSASDVNRGDKLLPGKIALSLACGDYEIVRPLKEGLVEAEGIELTILTGQDSNTRHWRFLRNREYDVAELSCSSYAVARDQGLPFTAIPVFLHRRFRHGFIYINTGKGITKPADLIGRKIGLKQFQSTAIVWMRGILEHEYGVPHGSVEWYPELDESVEFEPPPGVTIKRLPHDKSVVSMLVSGELDAALHPELIRPIRDHDPRVARLFADYRREEESYYRKTGIFPIMHLLGIRQELVGTHPWIPRALTLAFDQAREIAMRRMREAALVPLVFYGEALEEQQQMFGPDPWEYGLGARNRHNIDTLIDYSQEQGQTRKRRSLEELFVAV